MNATIPFRLAAGASLACLACHALGAQESPTPEGLPPEAYAHQSGPSLDAQAAAAQPTTGTSGNAPSDPASALIDSFLNANTVGTDADDATPAEPDGLEPVDAEAPEPGGEVGEIVIDLDTPVQPEARAGESEPVEIVAVDEADAGQADDSEVLIDLSEGNEPEALTESDAAEEDPFASPEQADPFFAELESGVSAEVATDEATEPEAGSSAELGDPFATDEASVGSDVLTGSIDIAEEPLPEADAQAETPTGEDDPVAANEPATGVEDELEASEAPAVEEASTEVEEPADLFVDVDADAEEPTESAEPTGEPDAFTAVPLPGEEESAESATETFFDVDAPDVPLVTVEDSASAATTDEVDLSGSGEAASTELGESVSDEFAGETSLDADTEAVTFDTDDATGSGSEIPTVDIEMPTAAEIDLDYGGTAAPASSQGVSSGGEETIDLVDFPDQEIRAIIREVADLFDLNVVIPDSLVGRTSLKLRNVTWRQVFSVVLEPVGFTYVEDGNIIKIKSINDLEREPVSTRVYLINFADAAALQGSLTPLVEAAAGGRIQVDRRTNALIITERPSRMNDIQEVIERLDRPTAQVMIEAKFVDVSDTDDKNLGLDWSSLDGIEVGRFDGLYQASEGVGGDAIFSAAPTGALTTVLSAPEFNVVLRALKRNNNARLVSNPTVVAMNNTRAQINISEEYPIPEFTFNDETGTFEVSGFEYRPIGILLDVVPQVNSAGFINLTLIPEISSTNESVSFNSGGGASTEIPIIDTRKTETTVILKDGYTLAVGGLMENNTSTLTRKLPIFGDIPLAGRLFTSDVTSKTVRNLIIFVTARTLNPDGTSYEEIVDPRRLYEMGIGKRDIPGYEMPDEEKAVYQELRRLRSELRAREAYERVEKELALEAGYETAGQEPEADDGEAVTDSGYQRGFGVRR